MFEHYDIIVVGAGHAGSEAAAAGARLGSRVLLVTMNLGGIAQMSCNPAMGGIAKGQIVREIDALGGYSGIVTDHTMVQFRMLNRSKGPAMWSPRAQSDRILFSQKWREMLEQIPNLHFWQDTVTEVIVENGKAIGVKTGFGGEIFSKTVIITSGTFLNGKIHIGQKNFSGGRLGDANATGLTENLKRFGIESERLKTGTPVRVDGRSIDFSKMTEQKGDENPGRFSFLETPRLKKQLSCYLTYTSDEVHDVLRTGFDFSPMFAGRIQGTGPRYCPSIEDKIDRFSDKERHQLFIEPEGWTSNEYYVNGFSSSLPEEVQYKALKKIAGFEHARILKPGYAIEYDYFPPTQLQFSLESRFVENLFFAGQVNGTTGYEEAGGQGLIAGINARHKIKGKAPFVLKRSEAYIGVLIDDLVTKGTNEPYRMFTSRAEFRILLRQDNADQRLTRKGIELGLAEPERLERLEKKEQIIGDITAFMEKENSSPDVVNAYLERVSSAPIRIPQRMANLLLRPQVSLKGMMDQDKKFGEFIHRFSGEAVFEEALESVEIQIKYAGYLEKEKEIAEKITRLEDIRLGDDINYMEFKALSMEARQKLEKIKPQNIGQASRISGISPADVSVLLVHLGR
ncbi:MAG: tRNA uridine-5-carboxymethylaminomethyl(34) synthesis enzyme MnmG [Bacteroides sp.]|jgi:tRNA uridine 5-carboxymethylaminomethyl modification enzyme|nr:tRNA uridine-5-carboxymethylaminomethyl(34) synthesis enzyme MnmG [Bacteroides sp.]